MKNWQKALLFTLSHLVVALIAVVATLFLATGSDNAGMIKLNQLRTMIEKMYVGELDETAMFDRAAAGMVEGTGDRWSYYVPAASMDDYNAQKDNVYVGVGITISQREDGKGIDILTVEPGGSAQEQGLQPGDILVKVGGKSLENMTTEDISALIKGEENTQVVVTVLRQNTEMEFTLTRKTIAKQVAQGQMLEGNIGYIRIANFNTNCAKESIAWVDQLLAEGATALIFDVRYNGGGYVTELVKLLDHLLPEGDLFISEDYTGKRTVATSDSDCVNVPMMVLVNESSYSAAEFFAAALREYEKAKIVGLPTVGKGYFQNTFTLSDGSAVALSVGKYFTPKGVNLSEAGGLTPDQVVEVDAKTASGIYSQTLEPKDDPQIQAAVQLLSGKED